MKRLWICLAMLTCCAVPVLTQTIQELVNDGKNSENVLTQSMGYDRKSYSPLKQINKSNIKHLVPLWSTSVMNDQGELAQPTIYNGVMYVVNGKWTFAIDVETGPPDLADTVQKSNPESRARRLTEVQRRFTTAKCFG